MAVAEEVGVGGDKLQRYNAAQVQAVISLAASMRPANLDGINEGLPFPLTKDDYELPEDSIEGPEKRTGEEDYGFCAGPSQCSGSNGILAR